MMDGRRATCQWWTLSPLTVPTWGTGDWGVCELTRQVGTGIRNDPDHATLAYASGNTNVAGESNDVLVTHAGFGCVQWAAKDGAE